MPNNTGLLLNKYKVFTYNRASETPRKTRNKHQKSKGNQSSSFKLYPIKQLADLINNDITNSYSFMHDEDLKSNNQLIFRFVINTKGELWLSHEGKLGDNIPAHYEMTSSNKESAKCLTAGNITIDISTSLINGINHKSGDFRPDFISLTISLIILSNYLDMLAENINISALNNSGGLIRNFNITKSDIINFKPKDNKYYNIQESLNITTITRQPESVCYNTPLSTSRTRELSFGYLMTAPFNSSSEPTIRRLNFSSQKFAEPEPTIPKEDTDLQSSIQSTP